MRIAIVDEARNDLIRGFQFYERREQGLGTYFRNALFGDIERLSEIAGVHTKMFGYYHSVAKRFPFVIYYKIEDDAVRIHAVLTAAATRAGFRGSFENVLENESRHSFA